MSWELTADVDLVKQEEAYDLVMAFLSIFGDSIESLQLEVVEGEWDGRKIAQHTFEGLTGFSQALSKYCPNLRIDNNVVAIDIVPAVEHSEQAVPLPSIQLYAPANPVNKTRRWADAVLTFGNRKAYWGETRLTNGEVLTERFVIDGLKRVCEIVSPKSVFLHCEQTVSFPLDYHFIYHRDLAGFAEDLAEIVRISKYGGKGYQDGRRYYPAALSDINGSTMMWGHRRGEWLSKLKLFLEQRIPQLEANGIPTTFSTEFIDDVLVECEEIEFFHTNEGLGVYGLPLLAGYCEELYIEIIDRLAP
jgi:hypothetical protein